MAKKKLVKTGKKKAKQKAQGDWPMPFHNVLFRPDRLKYVRKIDRPSGCVFCTALNLGVSPDSLVLFKDQHSMVIMNKYPYNPGHLLVLPTRHCPDLTELTPPEYEAVHSKLRLVVQVLRQAQSPAAFNIGLNLGASAGAGIPEHMHYHIVPRWNSDLNFFPLLARTKVIVETLEQTYSRLLPYFQSEASQK